MEKREELMKAYKEGRILQCKRTKNSKWKDFSPHNQVDTPNLDFGVEWRIKPKDSEVKAFFKEMRQEFYNINKLYLILLLIVTALSIYFIYTDLVYFIIMNAIFFLMSLMCTSNKNVLVHLLFLCFPFLIFFIGSFIFMVLSLYVKKFEFKNILFYEE